ncbi:App1 family protein [Roseivirga sp.]|uniref:App1 family protein n=1 Tax=Roseivirga sp. TaxID=1964215 RepID=UPI003B51A680
MISSHPKWASYKEAPIHGNSFQKWWKSRFRFVDYPFILAYLGYGNMNQLILQGHVFQGMALSNPEKRASTWRNIISLIKMFLVKTVRKARVQLQIGEEYYEVKTNEGGFFEFSIENHQLDAGWHEVTIQLMDSVVEGQEKVELKSEVLIINDQSPVYISDIDDTFLVSHVTQKPLKLYTLLTKNAKTRKPVKGAVDFYQALHTGAYPFFYVSSSEWNLYEFLVQFIELNELPKGVLQLKDLKTGLLDFFKSGYGSHNHKLEKIKRIIELFPEKQFILLGDNGQHDPNIYLDIANEFPGNIRAIYIRGVKKRHWTSTEVTLSRIEDSNIEWLQFSHTHQAFEHARKINLIKT